MQIICSRVGTICASLSSGMRENDKCPKQNDVTQHVKKKHGFTYFGVATDSSMKQENHKNYISQMSCMVGKTKIMTLEM